MDFTKCAYMVSHFNCVCVFVSHWAVAHQALLPHGILQSRILVCSAYRVIINIFLNSIYMC